MMGGDAPHILAIMWAMTGLVFIFLLLRVYTRVFVVRCIGLDDHMYFWSWVFLALHNVFVQVAAEYGFGQDQRTLSLDDGANAHKFELVGQSFVIVGMGMAKISLALFLLRVVVVRWQRITIWAVGGSLMFASFMTGILCWLQCLPAKRIYDRRVDGRCIIDPVPWAILLGAFCIFVDLFFAVFPWIFLHKLEMKQREKLTVGISLSFSGIAGIFGIIRTTHLDGLGSSNYSRDTVQLVVWTAAEMSVTLIFIAIPCVIPLYLRVTKGTASSSTSPLTGGYKKHSQGRNENVCELDRMRPSAGMSHASEADEHKIAINGPFNETNITRSSDENLGDQAILLQNHASTKGSGIMVTDEVRISRVDRLD